ncbi:hypothetical protein XFPR_12315 [Xylella fastidiosa]|uniref:Uncharacterized protein n=1 Tax=Xylella fastidiosa TaxID=2371 RepID=A0ABD7BYE6_XYLFS|nr:hypothetical protein [Xylella fastidiosa]ETE35664.1 hypothetical protein B398_01670 [Xylella fastidiosa 32]MDG5823487.1 hypothetical protein [Xylella fastidiosa subsp. pauca]MDG5826763.1 hypothetical protein [Xylella fastidiosa subsp. pauca]QPB72642.1 hypothetical protein XFHB_13310 [Xylella fastidiosa]QPB72968.1 hypothetical protein XFPR_12315 [Xylella fastidiosa]
MSFVYSGFVEMTAKHHLEQLPEFKTGVAFWWQVRATFGRFVGIVLPVAMV